MSTARKGYPSDVSDEEWAFVAPYLSLQREDALQRKHDLRLLLRLAAGRKGQPSAVILDARTVQSTPESGAHAGYDGHKRRNGAKVHVAVDTLGHLLASVVTPANEQERAQVADLTEQVQAVTGNNVELASVDQGHTGTEPAAAAAHGLQLEVVKLPDAQGPRQGFILLPKRWVVERTQP